jgi:hypothetical protein
MDPEFFTIDQKKEVGLWSQEETLGKFLLPYLRRMAGNNKIIGLDYGVLRGETTYELLRDLNKIDKIYGVQVFEEAQKQNTTKYNTVAETNLLSFKGRFEMSGDVPNAAYDFVCINKDNDVYKHLTKTYHLIKNRGIIAGTDYPSNEVKKDITNFRKDNKVSSTIHIFNHFWFWYKT